VLRKDVDARMPRVDLPELLLEMHARTGFAAGFTHASEGGARAADVATSLCAVLIAEACNTSFEPLIRLETPALRRSRLSWVRQNYIRAETLNGRAGLRGRSLLEISVSAAKRWPTTAAQRTKSRRCSRRRCHRTRAA
jgi:hypothetical protein